MFSRRSVMVFFSATLAGSGANMLTGPPTSGETAPPLEHLEEEEEEFRTSPERRRWIKDGLLDHFIGSEQIT